MKYYITFFISLFSFLNLACSNPDYTITCRIYRLYDSKVILASMRGDAYKIVDTAELKNNTCTFALSDQHNPGVYKIIPEATLNQNIRNSPLNCIDIIFNHENISIKTVYPWLQDSLVVLESKENKVYFEYMKQQNQIQHKLDLLQNLLAQYPSDDEFYRTARNQYSSLQKQKQGLILQTTSTYPGSLAASLIALQKSSIPDINFSEKDRLDYIKQHYFDELDFNDERLINSNAYTHSIIQYIMLYRDTKLSQEGLEKEFMKAVDVILSHINQNPNVYDFLLNYLMEGFEQLKLENVLKYISNNYLNTVCTTDNGTTLKRRMEAYSKLAIGETVPDILTVDTQNKEIKLSTINTSYVLVVFWASWCPHCEEQLSKIKNWYLSKTVDLEVLAISIDTLKSDWMSAIENKDYNWLNGCDLKGWDGKAAEDYCLYATPTMFLLDNNKKILSKPLTYEDFLKALDFLGK